MQEGRKPGSSNSPDCPPPTPRTCSVPGLHTHHIACEEGLECHHSHCTDGETEAWRGADSWATGPIRDLSPRSAHSKLLSLTIFRLPVHSSPLPTPLMPGPKPSLPPFPSPLNFPEVNIIINIICLINTLAE